MCHNLRKIGMMSMLFLMSFRSSFLLAAARKEASKRGTVHQIGELPPRVQMQHIIASYHETFNKCFMTARGDLLWEKMLPDDVSLQKACEAKALKKVPEFRRGEVALSALFGAGVAMQVMHTQVNSFCSASGDTCHYGVFSLLSLGFLALGEKCRIMIEQDNVQKRSALQQNWYNQALKDFSSVVKRTRLFEKFKKGTKVDLRFCKAALATWKPPKDTALAEQFTECFLAQIKKREKELSRVVERSPSTFILSAPESQS